MKNAATESIWPVSETERTIREALIKRLPHKITDVHTHLGCFHHFHGNLQELAPIPGHTYIAASKEYHKNASRWWGDKDYRQIAFAFPTPGIDIVYANRYVLETASGESRVIPFAVVDLRQESRKEVLEEIRSNRFAGLKLHPALYDKRPTLRGMFTEEILELIREQQIPTIVHLPEILNPDIIRELDAVSELIFPGSIILSHCGNVRHREHLNGLHLVSQPNVFFETSTVTDTWVISSFLELAGPEKMLFGSDSPFNATYAQYHQTRRGPRLLTARRYNWVSDEDWSVDIDRKSFLSIHSQNIRAILDSFKSLGYKIMEDFFHNNSNRILTPP